MLSASRSGSAPVEGDLPALLGHVRAEQVVWISEHSDLLGDPLLGPEQQQRFLQAASTIEWNAIDARG